MSGEAQTAGALLSLRDVRRTYGERAALDGVTLDVQVGELVAVLGTSGSGKSTLLQVCGGLDTGYAGSAKLQGEELRALRDRELASLRHRALGFVFQGFHLVPDWTVGDNVALPARFAREPVRDLAARVRRVLERVGLEARVNDKPTALSGGQRQRVAIARALLLDAPLLLCDEPTGSLDAQTGESVLGLFRELHREGGRTLVLVTHEERVTKIATRVIRLEQGRVVEDTTREPA